MTLRPHQQDALENIMAEVEMFNTKDIMVSAAPGFGKEQPYSEPVLTPNGWTTMGDLQVEDQVIGSSGKPINITHIHEQGTKDVYEFTFLDGTSTRAGLEHLWEIHSKFGGKKGIYSKIMSTQELINMPDRYFNEKRLYIPTSQPVEFTPKQEPRLDPYALGLLLGDGGFTQKQISFSNSKQDIRDCLEENLLGNDTFSEPRLNKSGIKIDVNIIWNGKGKTGSSATYNELQNLGLTGLYSHEKFIPKSYLLGSVKNRMKLLQGLLDTDGYISHHTSNEYSTSSKQLAEDVLELARSLGIIARMSSRVPTYTHNGVKKEGKLNYRILIRWSRKYKSISSIKKLDYQENSRCITVDAPDSLYITKDYTLTHNSLVMSTLAQQLKGNSVIMVNIDALLQQISDHLIEINVDHSILKSGREKEFNEDHKVHLIMSQTYYARASMINIKCDYLIIDEGHREYDSKRTQTLIDTLEPKNIIRLSGTPWDKDGFAFPNSELIETVPTLELQEKGYLCPIKYYTTKWSEKIDYSSLKTHGGDYKTSDLDEKLNTNQHLESALEAMNKIDAKSKKTLIFCTSIEQADHFASILQRDGYNAEAYHSKKSKKANKAIIDAFINNTEYNTNVDNESSSKDLFNHDTEDTFKPVTHLVSISKLGIGFDCPDAQLGVLLRPTNVLSLFHQQVMRLARMHPSKQFSEMLDLAQCVQRFGFHTEPYHPPQRTNNPDTNKQILQDIKSNMGLSYLPTTISSGSEPEEIDLEKYNLKIKKLEERERKVREQKADIRNWNIKELASLFDSTTSIPIIIQVGAEIMTRKYDKPVSKAGNTYDYNYEWISEGIEDKLEQHPDLKHKALKAYRTRTRNIIKEGKNFNALKFFIDFLIEKHLEDKVSVIDEYRKANSNTPTQNQEIEQQSYTASHNDYNVTEDDEIPF